MATFGRNRQSIVDIQQQLEDIFTNHPKTQWNDAGEPVIPADSLVDVFDAFEDMYQDFKLLDDNEYVLFQEFLKANPGLQVTPSILVQYIAQKTRSSPPRSPTQPDEDYDRGPSDDIEEPSSRSVSRPSSRQGSRSRTSSNEPPQTPMSAKSPFDTDRRQRMTPHAPSSWNAKRPAPARRRKSDAGSRSDSEYSSPSAYENTTGGRTRTPSNPASPSMSPRMDSFSPVFGRPPSRPHSRAQSQPSLNFGSFSDAVTDDEDYTIDANPLFRSHNDDDLQSIINSLPMRRPSDDPDSEDEVSSSLGLVDRSTASMEPMDPMEALQRANEELSRKLHELEKTLQIKIRDHASEIDDMASRLEEMRSELNAAKREEKANKELSRKLHEVEKTLQNKLMDHGSEVDEMENRLEEMRSELSAAKREEKELRSKERQNLIQIGQLEMDIVKANKNLEAARLTYQSLQRQYQEQCASAERYRDDLREREESIRSARETRAQVEEEVMKNKKEREAYEVRIAALEQQLVLAQEVHAQLDEQKQENLLLKETIDRMRFEMDEMRLSAAAAAAANGSGQSSAANSLSKSLGAELAGRMKDWEMDDDGDETAIEQEFLNEEIEVDEGEDTEGEDVVETIITRTKRKVASRANKMLIERFEETKEYSDSSCQYEPHLFLNNHQTQTDPEPKVVRVSLSTQTEPPRLVTFAAQTDPEPIPIPRIMTEMEIQTDGVEEEEEEEQALDSRSSSPPAEQVESLASSSSTIVPPTPKARPQTLEPTDEPPAYTQTTSEEQEAREWRSIVETLKKYHPNTKIPFQPIAGGVSTETIEEWKAFKEQLGVDCLVIDKVIKNSERTTPRTTKDNKRRSGRFYNIYNTYVYGDKTSNGISSSQVALWIGASALVVLAVGQYMVPQNNIPGGPTYYDRAAWNSFNSMQGGGEGFSPDGTAAVWNFMGRVGDGAARIVRGWPT